ncbi:DUF397 domain-containing protein [Streptomyces sp. HGB0020]|jgi:hypothetical protein|uniref:DUF397 domain-containing protein n=1 Tax=Streptomyces sp. HGB0020 TaxID=1078086 RepID=UPI00034EA78A|nr:DUF397 domain-containing protein [Streptomyces sp. HGB0020]EPD56176.1 hypothetical protein HMPREF1211_07294 [Streptomyces sp. HGB0020]
MGSSPDLTRAQWRRSSYSGSSGGECVEVATLTQGIAIRDSKNPAHGILTLTPEAWAALVAYVRR